MKSKYIFTLPLAAFLILVYGFGGDAKYPGGSPGGYTGSPGDGKDCTQCHNGSSSAAPGWITSDIPEGGYIPGETYTITATASGNGDKGFEISPQDGAGNLLGVLIAGSGTHLVSGNKSVTHNSASSSDPKVWQFEWTAPEAGTGDVTFYGAFTVNKPVTKLSSLVANENTAVAVSESLEYVASLYPNPASEKIYISYFSTLKNIVEINLISMDGRSYLLSDDIRLTSGMNKLECSIPDQVPPGIYILLIRNDKHSSSIKLIIE